MNLLRVDFDFGDLATTQAAELLGGTLRADFSFPLFGPKGDKGDSGDAGPQGIQGVAGPKGDKGDTGNAGPQGIQGVAGPKGDTGDTGPVGPKGDKGDPGDAGPQGPAGPSGASDWTEISGKPSTFVPAAHASTHHTGGTDAIAPNNISAAWAQVVSSQNITGNTVLSAGRNRRITLLAVGVTANVDLPFSGNQSGDIVTVEASFTFTCALSIRRAVAMSGGSPVAYATLGTLTASGQSFTFVSNGTDTGWSILSVDTHTHAASQITDFAQAAQDYTVVSTAQTLTVGAKIAANTTAGAFTLTLPATPANGDTVSILDYAGTFDTNNLTIARNGSNIESLAEDMDCNIEDAAFSLVYVGSTVGWKVVPYFGNKTNFASPDPIGSSVANTGAFTNLSASGTLSGAGFTNRFASPGPIGSTTPSTGAFTTLSANNGTVTSNTPAFNVTQTINNAVNTFNLAELTFNVTGGSSNSAYLTCTSVSSGVPITHHIFRRNGYVTAVDIVGQNGVRILPNGNNGGQVLLTSNGYYAFTDSTTSTFGTQDLFLRRDAAGILAQHNLANPQTFRIYNTTDAGLTNFERGFLRWSSNVLQIGTEAGGTGSNRNLELRVGAATYTFSTVSSIASSGSFVAAASSAYFWQNRGRMYTTADGVFVFANNGDTDFGRLCFGGSTSAFPALKRSSTTLQVRLADDSADAPFSSGAITTSGTVTANNTSSGFVTSSAPNGASPVRFAANTGDVLIQSANAAGIVEFRGTTGTNPQSLRVFNTFTSGTSFERLNIRWASNECIIDAEAGSGGGTLRGIKIGSATSSLLGFYGATPAAQPAAVADATDAASTQARLNDLLARLRTIGIIAT